MGVWSLRRGILWLNLVAVPSGLRGVPVGTSAKALRANGLSPFFRASAPVAVKMPHLTRSRRVICPEARAFLISVRLSRARCASRCLMRDALSDIYMVPHSLPGELDG